MSQELVDQVKSLSDSLGPKLDATLEKANDAVRRAEATEKAVEEKVGKLEDWVGDVEKKITVGLASVNRSREDQMLDAIPEDVRKYASLFGLMKSRQEQNDSGRFENPSFKAASALWFDAAARLQCRNTNPAERAALGDRMEKLERAFADVYRTEKAAYTGGTDSTGGYTVPNIIEAEVLRIALDSSVVYSRGRKIPMTSDTLNIPNEATGFTVYFSAEAATLTGGENTLGTNLLTAKKIIGRATASIEATQDWIVAMMPYVQGIMAEGIGRKLDLEALEGTGTNFTGVVTESGVNSVATTTTDGAAITFQKLVKATFAAGEQSTRNSPSWFMNPKILAGVIGLIDTNGTPIFQYANVPGTPQLSILGYPVHASNALSVNITRGATGSTGNMYFGDPQKLIFGERMGMQWDVSDAPNWATYSLDMRLVTRKGFTVATPAAWTKVVGCILLP